jgi:GNAT superfamily N-acetyltransferase
VSAKLEYEAPLDRWPFRTFRGQQGTLMRVTRANWHTVKKRVVEIERKSFAPSIQDSARSLARTALSPSAIVIVAFVADETMVAYAMADELERFDDVPGVKSDPRYGHKDTIYLSSVAVEPEWRGRGIGVTAEQEIVAIALQQGYSRVTAHMRSSARLGDRLSRKVLGTFSNWYGTGVPYDYVDLEIVNAARKPRVRARG